MADKNKREKDELEGVIDNAMKIGYAQGVENALKMVRVADKWIYDSLVESFKKDKSYVEGKALLVEPEEEKDE